MTRLRWLFLLVLGMPALGVALSVAMQTYIRFDLERAATATYPDAPTTGTLREAVEKVCHNTGSITIADMCIRRGRLRVLALVSIWCAVVGLALLGIIHACGRAAQSNRSLLLSLFAPGLYVTIAVLAVLVIAHAAIAVGVFVFVWTAIAHLFPVTLLFAIVVGAVGGVTAMLKNAFAIVQRPHTFIPGTAISREAAPALWSKVDAAAERLGSLKPDHIVLGLPTNFFVTETDVIIPDGKLIGRTLYCSLPLGRILTADEFIAIIGHELAHFKGEDTKFSERFYPIYRGTGSALAALHETNGNDARLLALFPAVAVLSYFLECFAVAENNISREREFAADQAGASTTNTATIASALIKLHAFSGIWYAFDDAAREAIRDNQLFVNASKSFADAVARNADVDALEGIAEIHLAHPTDSHPTLAARLASLNESVAARTTDALNVAPAATALAYIPDNEAIEEALTNAYQMKLARHRPAPEFRALRS